MRFEGDVPWDEFTVVTARDVPAPNRIALILDDQPCLADDVVNHAEEPVLLLAHPDKSLLERARTLGRHRHRSPAGRARRSTRRSQARTIVWGTDNVFKSFLVARGDVDAAFRDAYRVVEGEYETGAQEQLYIEPQGMIAMASPADGITVWGSMQCPYYIHKALTTLFGLPARSRARRADGDRWRVRRARRSTRR